MSTANLLFVAFVLGITFAGAAFFIAAPFVAEWRRANATVDAAQTRVLKNPSPAYQAAWEKHVADALRATEEASGLSSVAPVIPLPRKAAE